MKNKIIVGTNHIGYPQIRNFAGLPFSNFEIKKTYDVFKLLDYLHFKITKKNNEYFHNSHYDFGLKPDVKLYHFFNTISYCSKPWVVTFEHFLPRYDRYSIKGMKLLASNSCKKIIAFSHSAYQYQKNILKYFPDIEATILAKMIIIEPAQKLHIENFKNKANSEIIRSNDEIVFTFVGGDFFRKGGSEILKVFSKLIDNNKNVKLNIVSKLSIGGWMDQHITKQYIITTKQLIQKYSNNIFHHHYLPNHKVLQLLRNSDIGLLPSYGETYGYFVLEAQSFGCPVISTNLPIFNETNNKNCGWLIDVPLTKRYDDKVADVYDYDKRKIFSVTLEKNLYEQIEKIIANPEQIKDKATKSIEKIKNKHNPEKIVCQLEEIYYNALNKI